MPNQNKRPVILVICDYYLPGFESGGAMRTIVNMVDRLGREFDFRIVTRDHDGPLNRAAYVDVRLNQWNRVGNAEVYYLSKTNVRVTTLRRLISGVSPGAIYLNSFFSPLTISVLLLRRLKRIGPIPIILAPEGEFSPGALRLKSARKRVYIQSSKMLRLVNNLVWKAGSESERDDIARVLEKKLNIMVAPNMPPVTINANYRQSDKPEKIAGSARMVFLSRFMRKKNFNWLLEHLRGVNGDMQIDICGPIEETDYWNETRKIIKTLPNNINIRSLGPVPHDEVAATLMKYHFFILPTLGENFGHVFVEALAAGCPLIISDRTPWRNLEQKSVGWDLPLEDPHNWIVVLNNCLAMNQADYTKISQNARHFAQNWLSDPALEESNRNVFRRVLQ